MNFFKKWFQNMCREAWENERGIPYPSIRDQAIAASKRDQAIAVSDSKEIGLHSSGTQFTVYKADGGFVVETSYRDRTLIPTLHF